jgi:hypothetical protein
MNNAILILISILLIYEQWRREQHLKPGCTIDDQLCVPKLWVHLLPRSKAIVNLQE